MRARGPSCFPRQPRASSRYLAEGFFADVFLTGLSADFVAGAPLLAAVFFAGAVPAVVFFAAGFFAGALFLAALVAVVFFVAVRLAPSCCPACSAPAAVSAAVP